MIRKFRIKSIAMFILIALTFTMLFPTSAFAAKNKEKDTEITYDVTLFDQSYVHTIDVQISEEDYADMLANPTSKTKYQVNVVIDGEEIDDVSISTKGNTSLSNVASMDSNRYSFKINFGKFVDGQTYHGLKKLNLSNLFADATYMKDYISYEIFRKIGVNSALTSYVMVYINGEAHGLYLAVENIDGTYLDRTTNGEGELYKPSNGIDDMNEGFGDREDMYFDAYYFEGDGASEGSSRGSSDSDKADDAAEGTENAPEAADAVSSASTTDADATAKTTEAAEATEAAPAEDTAADAESESDTSAATAEAADGESNGESSGESSGEGGDFDFGGGMFGFGGGGGCDLAYIDDELSSYSGIFNNAETKTTEEDHARVVEALKNLSEGNIEEALDSDEVIRYFAAHNFTMNYDSYTGSMLHNYYLYENDGKLGMLPWDYNLGYGGFGGGNASETVNYGIDSPLQGSSNSSRPMWGWIVSNEEYLQQYHDVYDELLTNYFESGEFEAEIERVYEMIRPYVEEDPSAFYTVEDFDTGVETIKNFCLARAESIRKQLNGELSTVTNSQNAEDRVDTTGIVISNMGSMNSGSPSEGDSEGDSDDRRGDSRETAAEGGEAADTATDSAEGEAAPAETAVEEVPAE